MRNYLVEMVVSATFNIVDLSFNVSVRQYCLRFDLV